jgi:hypothetical protein
MRTPPFGVKEIKAEIRKGEYAWPGGYPRYFVCSDGEAMCFACVKKNFREIVDAHRRDDRRSSWHLAGVEVNWEQVDLVCSATGLPIEAAYA